MGVYPLQWIPARFWGKNQPNNDGDVVTMHTVESGCVPGMAVSLAKNWFQTDMIGSDGKSHPASATYMTDPTNSVQMVDANRIAWHCGNGNRRGIGIEQAGRASFTRAQWLGDAGTQTMLRAAVLAATWMKPRNIPVKWLTTEQTRNGARGINGHINMSQAYGGSSHTDPDDGRSDRYPHDIFLRMVSDIMKGDLPVTPQERAALVDAVWDEKFAALDPKTGKAVTSPHSAREWLAGIARQTQEANQKAFAAQQAAINALISAVGADAANDLTEERLRAIIQEELAEHLPPEQENKT
jgi:N-acetylmuramoyl-L-alanine amidase